MTLFPLRPLQQRAIDGLRASWAAGKRRPIIQAPTGFGKTVIAARIVAGVRNRGKRVGFCVPALSLIDQTLERLIENGFDLGDMGVVQADHPLRRPHAPIQICSLQTVASRGFPMLDFVLFDEVHIRHEVVDKWIAAHPNMLFVGLSATPWSKGLGDLFDDLIIPTSIDELTREGWLAPIKGFAPSKPDLDGIKIVGGDYHAGHLAERMSKKEIVGDVVSTWLARAEGRSTLGFAVDRAHADTLQREFTAAGCRAAYCDANTPRDERNRLLASLNNGSLSIICSIGTMTTGIDADVRCIVYARPTKSEMRWVQSIGRGMRIAPYKQNLLLLDHSGTALELGLPGDIHHDRLRCEATEQAERERKAKDEDALPSATECPQCGELVPAKARQCRCGWVKKRPSTVRVLDGELIEIGGSKSPSSKTKMSKLDFLSQLKGYAEEKGKSSKWVNANFHEKTDEWPQSSIKHCAPKECGPKVRSWIKSRQIAWARRRQTQDESVGA